MVRSAPVLLGMALAMLALTPPPFCRAQFLPPEPIPVTPISPKDPVMPQNTPVDPMPVPLPPPMQPPYVPDVPYPPPHPMEEHPWSRHTSYEAEPGWFASVELGVVGAHINNHVTGSVTVPGYAPNVVQLPTAQLDWVGVPRFELGYRFAEGYGELAFAGRFLQTVGHATIPNFDIAGDGDLRSRLELDVLDFGYANRLNILGPQWDMRWQVGARLANAFFDSQADGYYVDQQASNHFFGAGPHADLSLRGRFGESGVSAFGKVEGSALIGRVHQNFSETLYFDDGSVLGAGTSASSTQAVPILNFETGLSWVPYYWPRTRYTVGYEFEHWWNVGNAGGSHADVTDQGIFFRAEVNY